MNNTTIFVQFDNLSNLYDPGERGRVFGVWLSGAIATMALEQVWDSAGPNDTGININPLTPGGH